MNLKSSTPFKKKWNYYEVNGGEKMKLRLKLTLDIDVPVNWDKDEFLEHVITELEEEYEDYFIEYDSYFIEDNQ